MKAWTGRENVTFGRVVARLAVVGLIGALLSCSGNNPTYPVGGNVGGLSASGLVLANGSDKLQVAANASSFMFPTRLAAGATYAVTIQSQPAGQTCLVGHGTGTVASVAINDVSIVCTGPWVWKGGADTKNAVGVYGTRGVAAAGNVPGARESSMTWTDGAGNFWLFGGTYIDATGDLFYLNDLWRYTPSNGLWTWISGSSVPGALYGTPGIYGVQGTASPSNMPGARANAASWIDSAGTLWLFGGFGYDSANLSDLNDLWKYAPDTGEWTWVSGPSSASTPTAVYGTQGVPAPANLPPQRQGSVGWVDSMGNLWLFGGIGVIPGANVNTEGWLDDLWTFSPVTGEWTWVSGSSTANPAASYGTLGTAASSNVPDGRDAAASWIDSADNLWLFGGNALNGYHNDLWKFTPSTNQWTWVSGANTLNGLGVYGTQGSSAAVNVPSSRFAAASWVDASGNFWLFGGDGVSNPQTSSLLNDLWMFSPGTGQWTWVSGSSSGDLAGVYGTLGTAAPTNAPGGRDGTAAWIDGAGDLWLFGGTGTDSPTAGAELNDLWQYQR
jgi:N-acetylneuraminic acid mutarotase